MLGDVNNVAIENVEAGDREVAFEVSGLCFNGDHFACLVILNCTTAVWLFDLISEMVANLVLARFRREPDESLGRKRYCYLRRNKADFRR